MVLFLVLVVLPSDVDLILGGPPSPLQDSGPKTLSDLFLLVLVSETRTLVLSGPAVDLDLI